MLRPLIAVLLASAVAVAAPVPKSLKKAPALDGRWEATILRSSGGNFLNQSNLWVWDFDGEKVTRHYKQPDGTMRQDGTATLTRPDASSPQEVDYNLPSGNSSTLFRARIEIDGDELTINFAEANETRPPDMTEMTRGYYYRFKRVEKK